MAAELPAANAITTARALAKLYAATIGEVRGHAELGEIFLADQSPLARTPRSNPAIYTGAWELIRTALGYTLTLPLGVPLYGEADHLPRAIECLLHCLLKTDV